MTDTYGYTATYSPDDNKLRLYAATRLDADTYARVRAAGFRWAPKQDLFVAPAWSPAREDLLLELAGEVGDEDTSLVDRAEDRAERFEGYSDKREADAHAAHAAVERITSGIPMGQPILVGHHSERHARKDAERIENGMRKAVKMWRTAKYWEQRASGALRHAKYKELPGVRARRIKSLESEARQMARTLEKYANTAKLWATLHEPNSLLKGGEPVTFAERALYIAGHTTTTPHGVYDGLRNGTMTPEDAQTKVAEMCAVNGGHATRWAEHLAFRIGYERAMLAEQGASALLDKAPRPKQLPLCNYRAPQITCDNPWNRGETITYPQVEMTAAEYARINKDYKGTRAVGHSHRVRTAMVNHALVSVFLTDSKVHDRPGDVEAARPAARPVRQYVAPAVDTDAAPFDAMAQTLKAGVQVVSAPQLFPTPQDVAQRMVELADIEPGHRVLEPSAGTGALLGAMGGRMFGHYPERGGVVAVEINHALCQHLEREYPLTGVQCTDFLDCRADLPPAGESHAPGTPVFGRFDRIVMNPPFERGSDIEHIQHARSFLAPGGRLVAICANGPRQQAQLQPIADSWEDLPAGTFDGTGVRAALVTFTN